MPPQRRAEGHRYPPYGRPLPTITSVGAVALELKDWTWRVWPRHSAAFGEWARGSSECGGYALWQVSYVWPDPHQHAAPRCGGHSSARPRAASVVAYWGRRSTSAGDDASEAAKAS